MKELAIQDIKPDKSQPRKFVDDSAIAELAANIEKTGLIQPIEVDEKNVIVCGELRYRAYKKLKMKTIPVRVIKGLTPEKRLLRQLSENMVRKDMTPLEEAEAFKKALEFHFGSSEPATENRVSWLKEAIGVDKSVIIDRLNLLEQPKKFQKAVESGTVPTTAVRAIKMAPEKMQPKLREKILKGQAGTRDASKEIARRLKTRPEKAEEILAEDFTAKNHYQTRERLNEIAPDIDAGKMQDVEAYFEEVESLAGRLSQKLNAFLSGEYIVDVQAKELGWKCGEAKAAVVALAEGAIPSWTPLAEKYMEHMTKAPTKGKLKKAVTIDETGKVLT